jgi:hypothetical protein
MPGLRAEQTMPSEPYLFAHSLETRTLPFDGPSDISQLQLKGSRLTSLLWLYSADLPLRTRAGLSRSVLKSIELVPSAAKEAVLMIRECPSRDVLAPASNVGIRSCVKRNGLVSLGSTSARQSWMVRTRPRSCRIGGRNRRQ